MILVPDYGNGQIMHREECRAIEHNSEPWLMIVCNNFCHWNHFPILILTVHVDFPNSDFTFFKCDLKK